MVKTNYKPANLILGKKKMTIGTILIIVGGLICLSLVGLVPGMIIAALGIKLYNDGKHQAYPKTQYATKYK